MKNKETIFLVKILAGGQEDTINDVIFATFDKYKATEWCDRFNHLVKENSDRIKQHQELLRIDFRIKKIRCFDFFEMDPEAYIEEIEVL